VKGAFIFDMFGSWDALRTEMIENWDGIEEVLGRIERL